MSSTCKHRIFKCLIFATLFSFSAKAQKDDISGLKLRNKQSILNGKAFFDFPDSAKNMARAVDIMSADRNAERETRIIFDKGDMRLVFFAQQLEVLADGNLFSEVKNDNDKEFDFTKKLLTNKDSVLSILSTPAKFDPAKNAILINSLLVKTQDNTVFRIDAYINPKAYEHKDSYQKLSERVFNSLTKGNRYIDLQARKQSCEIMETGKKLVADLPKGYTVTTDAKYDFQVLRFHKYTSMSDTNWQSLTIYTGDHPSYAFGDNGLNKEDAKIVAGRFLGKDVEWLSFYDAGHGMFLKEQIIPLPEVDEHMVAHVIIKSNSELSIAELTEIVEKMSLGK